MSINFVTSSSPMMSMPLSNTSQPDPFVSILERLNGMVLKVTKLRQFIDDLETELSDIRRLCENEIRPCTIANASKAAIMADSHYNSHALVPVADVPSYTVSSPSVASSCVPGGSGSSTGVVNAQKQVHPGPSTPVPKHAEKSPIQEQIAFHYRSRPPSQPPPFPKFLDFSACPPELERKGDDWFVLFNSSSKVKRLLDVDFVYDLVNESAVQCVRFSRDGKRLATGCSRTAHIYDVKTGVETCFLDHANNVFIWCLCFSPDGKYLATGTVDRQIRIWNISERQIHSILKGHQGTINSLLFSPMGQFIISGSGDGSVRIWDVHTSRVFKVLTIDGHYLPDADRIVWAIAISPDGRYVAVGSQDAVVSIWEVTTGVLAQKLRGHSNGVSSVAFTPDGKGLISGSFDQTLKYWDVNGLDIESGAGIPSSASITSSSPCLMNLTSHEYGVRSTAFSHDGTWVVSGSLDGKVLFWDTRTGVAQCVLSAHKEAILQVDSSPMGNLLVTVGWDGRARIWSYGTFG